MIYLVINNNDDMFLKPYVEKYRIFNDKEKMHEYVVSIGWNNLLGFNLSPGVMNISKGGEIDISIITLEVS